MAAFALSSLIVGVVLYQNRHKPESAFSDMPAPAPPIAAIETLSLRDGGAPIGEPLPQAPRYDNETLHKDIERQKAAMGIRKILPPDDSKLKEAEADQEMISAGFEPPKPQAPQPLLQGSTPRMPAPGARPSSTDSSGFVGVVPPFGGVVVLRPADMPDAWAQAGLQVQPPVVDFSRNILVIAPGSIKEVRETDGRIVVHYSEGGAQAGRYALIAKTSLPVVFEKSR